MSTHSSGRRLVSSVAAGNAAVLVLGLASGVVAARALGPVGRGQFFGSYTVATILSGALGLGVVQALVTYRGRLDAGRPLLLQVIGSAVVTLLVASLLALSGVQGWLGVAGVLGCALWCAGTLLSALASGLAQRRGDMARGYQSVRLLPQASFVASMVVLWIAGVTDPDTWLLVTGAAMTATAAVQFVPNLAGERSAEEPRRWLPPGAFAREARAIIPVTMATLAGSRIDVTVAAVSFAPRDIALYSVASAALGACVAFGNAVGMVAFSQLRTITDVDSIRALLRTSLARAVLASALVAAPVAVAAPWLIRHLFGSDFVGAADATRILAAASVPASVAYLLLHVLLSLGSHRAVTWNYLLAAAVMLVTFMVAGLWWGLAAAATSVLTGNLLLALLLLRAVRRALDRRLDPHPAD